MKIKQIIYFYISAFSFPLFGGATFDDKEIEKAIAASLRDQHKKDRKEQNAEYRLTELEQHLNNLKKQVENNAYRVFFDLNEKIQEAKNKNNENDLEYFKEQIKYFIRIIPHEVLEGRDINRLTAFTTMLANIQRGKSKIHNPITQPKDNELLSKIKIAEENIEIYEKTLQAVNAYIEEYNIPEDPREEEKRRREEKQKEMRHKIQELLTTKQAEKQAREEEEKALNEVAEFQKQEEERNRIERENDPRLQEIKKIKEMIYKNLSDYFNKKDFEAALKNAKEKHNQETIDDIQKNIEDIMQYCPHEFFIERNNFPEIKKIFEQGQRSHSAESKIINTTEKNEENLNAWQGELKKLKKYIFFDNLILKTPFTKIKFKAEKTKKNHFQTGLGIGLAIGLGGILFQHNFFKSSRKKIDLLQKAVILSSFGGFGAISGNSFFKLKKYYLKNKNLSDDI
jgi:hypothetical protein